MLDETAPDFEKAAVILKPKTDEPKRHPPGTVVALAGEAARYTRFAVCMQSLAYRVPAGSAISWVLGSDIPESRNQACADLGGEWVWFIDDDHSFRDDILLGLLDREVDIVAPICLRRNQPFLPVACVNGDFMRLDDHAPEALVEVEHTGSSGMLIRRNVIDALSEPWFELGEREGNGNRVSEDVWFCRKAREAGFKIHVDMRQRLAHLTTAAVWPVYSEEHERWLTGFTVADGAQLAIDPGVPAVPDTTTQ